MRPSPRDWSARGHVAILAIVLIASFLLKFNNLGHLSLKGLDESFHAVVARNLLNHPLTPTLVDQPVLPYDYRSWQENHVWLHKPVLPLWQIALSFALLGVNTLALRLPSAILATASIALTYLIGRELFDRTAGLIAAIFQATAPVIVTVVQGYIFSDHVDIALLFWTELAIWMLARAMRTGAARLAILAGIAQGLAFLSKTYPALIASGVAFVIWTLNRTEFERIDPDDAAEASHRTNRFSTRQLVLLLIATLLTAGPWMLYTAIRWPREFAWENLRIFQHLSQNVEGFAAPWDRLVFDYGANIFHLLYPTVLVSVIVLAIRAWRERNPRLVFILAWALGVVVPHLLASSKTPTATLIGWPAFFLLFAEMIRRAVRGDLLCLGAWTGGAVAAAVMLHPIPRSGFGYPDPPVAGVIMQQNLWIIWQTHIALTTGLLLTWLVRSSRMAPAQRRVIVALATIATLFLGGRMTWDGWRITEFARRDSPSFVGLASRERLPDNAVLLVEERQKLEHIAVMFYTGRTAYPVTSESWTPIASDIHTAGGSAYLLTHQRLDLPLVMENLDDDRRLYDLRPHPRSASDPRRVFSHRWGTDLPR